MNEPSKTAPFRHRWLEVLILLVAFLAINVAGARFQKTVSFNGGKGWEDEGVLYYQVAEQFARGQPIAVGGPIPYRVGTPFLAAHVDKNDLFFGFKVVNLVANSLSLALLIVWLSLYVRDWRIRVGLGLMFLLQWDAPTRLLWFQPIHVDPWLWVFLLAGLIAVHHVGRDGPSTGRWLGLLCVTSFVGVMFREVALMVPLTLLFARNPLSRVDGAWAAFKTLRPPPAVFFAPLAFGLLGLFLVRLNVRQTDTYSFGWTAQHWVYTKALPILIHSWLLAFGPMLFLVIYDWRRAGAFLWRNQFLLVYLLGCGVLGYIGGSESARLWYWSMPAVYVLLGRALEEHKPMLRSVPLLVTLAICQLIASRAFMLTPDEPNAHPARSIPLFTPGLGHHFRLMDLVPLYGTRSVEMISLAEYLIFGLILFEWLNYRRRKIHPLAESTN